MKLYIIRHGESEDDLDDRFGGFANYDLTQKGREDARELAKKLKDSEIEVLFTSPYMRALYTAGILAKKLDINCRIENDIRERNTYGYLSGMRKKEAEKYFKDDIKKTKDKSKADEIDGSEKHADLVSRAKQFLNKLYVLDQEVCAFVSHGKFIVSFLNDVLKLEENTKPNDCGYYIVDLSKSTPEIIKRVNVKKLD